MHSVTPVERWKRDKGRDIVRGGEDRMIDTHNPRNRTDSRKYKINPDLMRTNSHHCDQSFLQYKFLFHLKTGCKAVNA